MNTEVTEVIARIFNVEPFNVVVHGDGTIEIVRWWSNYGVKECATIRFTEEFTIDEAFETGAIKDFVNGGAELATSVQKIVEGQ